MEKTLYSEKSAEFHVATCIDMQPQRRRNYFVQYIRAGKLVKHTRQVIHATVFVP